MTPDGGIRRGRTLAGKGNDLAGEAMTGPPPLTYIRIILLRLPRESAGRKIAMRRVYVAAVKQRVICAPSEYDLGS